MDRAYLDGLALLETAGGTKTIKGPAGQDSFNFYNVKDFSGKGFRAHDKAEGSNDAYRVYANREEADQDLIGLLGRKYPKALQAQSPEEFASALKEGGYATDPNYVTKLTGTIKRAQAGGSTGAVDTGSARPKIDRPTYNYEQVMNTAYTPGTDGGKPVVAPKPVLNSLQKAAIVRAGLRAGADGFRMALEQPTEAVAWDQIASTYPEQGNGRADIMELARIEGDLLQAEHTKNEGITFGKQIANAFIDSPTATAVRWFKREGIEPEAGFKPDEERLKGWVTHRQTQLQATRSTAEFNALEQEFNEQDTRTREMSAHGIGQGITAGIIGGIFDPGTIALTLGAGAGLAALGRGSFALAQAGRPGAAFASSLGENAVVNIGTEAIRQAAGGDGDTLDLWAAGAMSALPGTLQGLYGASAARSVNMRGLADAALAADEPYKIAARANLGDTATEEALAGEVNRLKTADRAQPLQDAVSRNPDRQLFPTQEDPTVEAPARVEEDTKLTEVRQEHAVKVEEEAAKAAESGQPALKPVLPEGLTKASPRWKTSKVEFASDVDKALYITSQSKKSKADAQYRAWLGEQGLDDAAIEAGGKRVRAALKQAGTDAEPGAVIRIEDAHERMPVAETTELSMEDFHALARQVEAEAPKTAVFTKDMPVEFEAKRAALRQDALEEMDAHTAIRRGREDEDALAANGVKEVDALVHKQLDFLGMQKGLENVRVFFMGREKFVKHFGQDASGVRMAHTGDIVINVDSSGKGLAKTISHEVSHALTVEKLYYGAANPNTGIGQATKQIDELLVTTKAAFEAAKASGKMSTLGAERIAYRLSNVREFVAGFYSGDDVFTAWMKTQGKASKQDNSLLSKFARAIGTLFGLAPHQTNNFLRGLDMTDRLIQAPLDVRLRDTKGNVIPHDFAPPSALFDPNPTWILTNPTAQRVGLDLLPVATVGQQYEARALIHIHEKAATWAAANPKNAAWEKRVKTLTDNRIFSVDSTALIMLKSENDVVRYIASELLEDASGVTGKRQTTAAISKHIYQRMLMDNVVNDMQDIYAIWAKNRNVGSWDAYAKGEAWERFNKEVAAEIEFKGRGTGRVGPADPVVSRAVEALEAAYERNRNLQVRLKTPGYNALPTSSTGYMPHKMSAQKMRDLTPAQSRVLHSTLVDQVIGIEGWDHTFADKFASKYIDRMKTRAVGGHETPANVSHNSAPEVVEQALQAMFPGNQTKVDGYMAAYMKAGPSHTKTRIKLDLLASHDDGNGGQFRLLDLFETDQLKLIRGQSERVSGEAALSQHGVHGKAGLDLLRKAMQFGEGGKATANREFEAFDQVSAEFLGAPYGTAEGKWMERARLFTGVTKLGGIVFNQFAEYINGIVHVGAGRTLAAVGNIPRLRQEIMALARGEKVNNPIIGSIEQTSGATFGTDPYKIVFPWDDPGHASQSFGRDSLTATDRLLRGAGYVQSKLSMWRAVHGAQHRGMAEQIVRKALRYLKDGTDDVALRDMGIDKGMAQDLLAAARWNGDELVEFDMTKVGNLDTANAFTQAVHRGTNQIIQGTFIGEQGKWAHDGLMKTLTQFRTFSLTSMEKQWARQRNTRGVAAAAGILLGSMSMAAPIYMSRVYLSSVGRKDQQEYLEKNLTTAQIARATLNYVALSGLLGDWIDGLNAAVPGLGEATGGRTGANVGVVGNIIAPSAGTVDDIFQTLQNLDDPHKIARTIMPLGNLPYLVPALNLLDN